ncbi:MAG: tRNA (cytidine(34)-2'-O)-methyltransferase [Betaproteobacteria bacterium]|nr:tRNA (cytidine(34)-2'-O)-methyltransferase [Betaproteobacteria bacterium]
MLDVVLYRPEIPPNAGNVIRLAANTGARLHLVEPLGFTLEDRQLKRAGLDYHEMANVRVHRDWPACRAALAGSRLFAVSTRGTLNYAEARYAAGDAFVFGAETSGLPQALLEEFAPERQLRLPMRAGNRSLNLSNAVAVVVFEAWRQLGFSGAG